MKTIACNDVKSLQSAMSKSWREALKYLKLSYVNKSAMREGKVGEFPKLICTYPSSMYASYPSSSVPLSFLENSVPTARTE